MNTTIDSEEKTDVEFLSPIATPVAQPKTIKHLSKLVKRANTQKGSLKRGIKEVTKFIRKINQKNSKTVPAIVVLAGNVTPIDVISHLPVLCESKNVPYIYFPSKEQLGNLLLTSKNEKISNQSCSCVLVKPGVKHFDDILNEISSYFNK